MPQPALRFALNHIIAPRLGPEAFFALAGELGIEAVEIRNDLPGNAILDGTPAPRIRQLAAAAGVRILSINALQRFDDWRAPRPNEAVTLADYASCCGAEALVLVPTNDGSRPDRLRPALEGLRPILAARGLVGLIEPLGFETCSLRLKSEAVDAIEAIGGAGVFRLVHDTFHHHLAGEAALFPRQTGLVHISGVADHDLPVAMLRDAHRGPGDGGGSTREHFADPSACGGRLRWILLVRAVRRRGAGARRSGRGDPAQHGPGARRAELGLGLI